MILLDFSAVIFAALHADIKGGQKPQRDYIRHLAINTIRAYNLKFRSQFGEMFIICDNVSWRKSCFPLYKYARQWERLKNQEQSWDDIWDMFSEITQEIAGNLPYPHVSIKFAEADDIIGRISNTHDEPILIVSNDKDFASLLKNTNVKQYRPYSKEFLEVDDVKRFEYELIVKGDKADGIPNVRCPDDFFMAQCIQKDGGWKPERAKPINKAYLEEHWQAYLSGDEKEIEKSFGDDYRNFRRNRLLISFDYIPEKLNNDIDKALESVNRNSMTKLISYFQKNQMHLLAKHLSDFTPTRSSSTLF